MDCTKTNVDNTSDQYNAPYKLYYKIFLDLHNSKTEKDQETILPIYICIKETLYYIKR